MKRELCDDLAGLLAERDRLRDQVARLKAGADPVPPLGYRWQIRAGYTNGFAQSWPVDDEAAARSEYDLILAEHAAGSHEELAEIAIERRPIRPWEPVCSRRFDAAAAERG